MSKWKVVLPMAAIRHPHNQSSEPVVLSVGEILSEMDFVHGTARFSLYGMDYTCGIQVLHDCAIVFVPPAKDKVEVTVETTEEAEAFAAIQSYKEGEQIEILLEGTDPDVLESLVSGRYAANDDEFDDFEANMKYSVADAVARLYDINDRYVRDFQIRLFSDGSMQLRESDEVDAEIVMEFGDEQGFVVGDVHGNVQKWVNMIMDVGFVDYIINHKTSFAARYNLR